MHLSIAKEQQAEMRHAHYDGAPGILVSGLVWVAAALVSQLAGIGQGVWTLLIGGAFIYPVSALFTKALGRPAKTAKTNALNQLGIASTIWLILCCAMCYGLFLFKPALFFPAMMTVIGSRYLVFATMYGTRVFWMMGVTLIVAGVGSIFLAATPVFAAVTGSAIELLFALFVFSTVSKPAVDLSTGAPRN